MSRWSRRPQEEKEAIAKKLEDERYKKSPQYQQDMEAKIVESAYTSDMIPIRCGSCFKMSMSVNYTLTSDKFSLLSAFTSGGDGKLVTMINGECMWCHRPTKRAFPQSFSMDELMIATLVLAKLKEKGKLKDLR